MFQIPKNKQGEHGRGVICILLLVLLSCLLFAAAPEARGEHPLLKEGDGIVDSDGNAYKYTNGKFMGIGNIYDFSVLPELVEIKEKRLEEGDIVKRGEKFYEYTNGKFVEVEPESPTVSYDNSKYCTYGGGTTSVSAVKKPTGESPDEAPVTAKAGEKPIPKPPPSVTIVKATKTVMEGGVAKTEAVPGAMVKLNVPSPPLPVAGNKKVDVGYDKSPVQGLTAKDGTLVVPGFSLPCISTVFPRSPTEVNVDLTPDKDDVVVFDAGPGKGSTPRNYLPEDVHDYIHGSVYIGTNLHVLLRYPKDKENEVNEFLGRSALIVDREPNYCRTKQGEPNDPYFLSRGSWKQDYDDQWAIKRVGFTADSKSAWNLMTGKAVPVIVAVIDTGLDWNHKDISWENIWINKDEIPDNGIDDDENGYVDDVIGWNFVDRNNKPWDYDGHGTFVVGVIAATWNNNSGIAGINPHARIMVLKALNNFGHTRAFSLAKAVVYAADNGARVINLSVGGKHLTRTEQAAVDYAYSKGAVIVAAAGNEGSDTKNYGPAGLNHVITVASTDINDKRTAYSNWGQSIDIAAPGVDVLSLRARRTDLMRDIPDVEYTPCQAYVGADKRYYRVSGRGASFSAPIVAGTASLIFSRYPKLTNVQVERMLLQSAKDIEVPGRDQFTGFGLLDAGAALQADPKYYLIAWIQKVQAVKEKGELCLEVLGTVDGSDFKEASIDLGFGEEPDEWGQIVKIETVQKDGRLGLIQATSFKYSGRWTVRLQVKDKKEKVRESRASVIVQ